MDMAEVKAFNAELSGLYDNKPPISKAKMSAITRGAIKAIKFYKHVVHSVEKFIAKCKPEYKVPGLYVIDAIVRQSRHQFGQDKDVFAPRFAKNMQQTAAHLFRCPPDDKRNIIRVLNLWQKNSVFTSDVIQPLLDMADPNHPLHAEIAHQNANGSLSKNVSLEQKASPASAPSVFTNVTNNVESSIQRDQSGSKFNKLLDNDFDYESEDEPAPMSEPPPAPAASTHTADTLGSILTNPEILRQLQSLQVQMNMMTAGVPLANMMMPDSTMLNPPQQTPGASQSGGAGGGAEEGGGGSDVEFVESGPQVIEIDANDSSRSPTPSRSRRRRSRSRHDSRRRSRSRSRSRRRSGRDREKDRERDRRREADSERAKKGLPPVKREHASVCSTTLWVGHLSKLATQEELSALFGGVGEVTSVDVVAPRGCAFVVMEHRRDAARAINKLDKYKLHSKDMTVAWAAGKGVKGREWKDYWEGELGVSYLPWDKLHAAWSAGVLNLQALEDGGWIDDETLPPFLKPPGVVTLDSSIMLPVGAPPPPLGPLSASLTGGVLPLTSQPPPAVTTLPPPAVNTLPLPLPLPPPPPGMFAPGMPPPGFPLLLPPPWPAPVSVTRTDDAMELDNEDMDERPPPLLLMNPPPPLFSAPPPAVGTPPRDTDERDLRDNDERDRRDTDERERRDTDERDRRDSGERDRRDRDRRDRDRRDRDRRDRKRDRDRDRDTRRDRDGDKERGDRERERDKDRERGRDRRDRDRAERDKNLDNTRDRNVCAEGGAEKSLQERLWEMANGNADAAHHNSNDRPPPPLLTEPSPDLVAPGESVVEGPGRGWTTLPPPLISHNMPPPFRADLRMRPGGPPLPRGGWLEGARFPGLPPFARPPPFVRPLFDGAPALNGPPPPFVRPPFDGAPIFDGPPPVRRADVADDDSDRRHEWSRERSKRDEGRRKEGRREEGRRDERGRDDRGRVDDRREDRGRVDDRREERGRRGDRKSSRWGTADDTTVLEYDSASDQLTVHKDNAHVPPPLDMFQCSKPANNLHRIDKQTCLEPGASTTPCLYDNEQFTQLEGLMSSQQTDQHTLQQPDMPQQPHMPPQLSIPQPLEMPQLLDTPQLLDMPQQLDVPQPLDTPQQMDMQQQPNMEQPPDVPQQLDMQQQPIMPPQSSMPQQPDVPQQPVVPHETEMSLQSNMPQQLDIPPQPNVPQPLDVLQQSDLLFHETTYDLPQEQKNLPREHENVPPELFNLLQKPGSPLQELDILPQEQDNMPQEWENLTQERDNLPQERHNRHQERDIVAQELVNLPQERDNLPKEPENQTQELINLIQETDELSQVTLEEPRERENSSQVLNQQPEYVSHPNQQDEKSNQESSDRSDAEGGGKSCVPSLYDPEESFTGSENAHTG